MLKKHDSRHESRMYDGLHTHTPTLDKGLCHYLFVRTTANCGDMYENIDCELARQQQ